MSKLFWFLIKFICAFSNKTIKTRLNLTFFDRIWWLLLQNWIMIGSVGTRTLSLNSLFLSCIKELFCIANSCIEFFWSYWIHVWLVINIIHFFIMKWSTLNRILINSIDNFDRGSLFLSKKKKDLAQKFLVISPVRINFDISMFDLTYLIVAIIFSCTRLCCVTLTARNFS